MGTNNVKKLVRILIACWLALIAAGAIATGVLANAHGPTFISSAFPQVGAYVPYVMAADNLAMLSTTPVVTNSSAAPMCRFGYARSENPLVFYDAGGRLNLRAGWYQDFGNHPPTPGSPDVEYAQQVHVHQVKTVYPSYTATYTIPYTYQINGTDPSQAIQNIAAIAQISPGAVWLIGNEIERRDWRCSNGTTCHQDEILPEVYADAYNEIYTALKAADPTARLAVGSQVEVSPLRLKYMDRVWNAYLAKYGRRMPVDVWNIHPYMLIEQQGVNGAAIPAGLTETEGLLYNDTQNDDLAAFEQQIVSFRQWMASKGEQNKPLIISEYGVLFPYWYVDGNNNPYTTARVINFMNHAFDYLLTAKDPSLGFAADDHRLVQQWNWYSLDNPPQSFNGALFSHTVGTISDLGTAWSAYVNDTNRPLGPALNLKMLSASYSVSPSGGNPYSATVWLRVSNSGYLNWTGPVTVTVSRPDNTQLGQVVLNGMPGCGRTAVATLQLTNIVTKNLPLKAQIYALPPNPEVDFSDNTIYFTILGQSLFLPVVRR